MTRQRNRRLLTDEVRDQIRRSILDGTYPPGYKLPPEEGLVDLYAVSRVTIREAVRGLVEEGYLSRRHGLGTYVTEKPRLKNNLDVNFGVTHLIQSMGMLPGNRDVYIREEPASERVASALTLEKEQAVIRLERVRTADAKPIVYSVEFLPKSLLEDKSKSLEKLSGSLYEFLQELGYPVHHGVTTVESLVANQELAQKLELEAGMPLLHMAQVDYSEDGQPYLFSLEWYQSEALQVTVYRRGPTLLTKGPAWAQFGENN